MEAVTDEVVHIQDYVVELVDPTVMDVYRRWREFTTLGDLRQEAAVWWYGPGQQYLPAYLAEDKNHVRLRRSIWRWCARYAEKEKASQSGYEPRDQVMYSSREILSLLPVALDPDGIPEGGGMRDDGPAPKGNLAEGGDALAALMDVRRALDRLHEEDRQFLELAEDLLHDWERLVTFMGADILPDTARRRHTRIVFRMTRWLNNYQEQESAA